MLGTPLFWFNTGLQLGFDRIRMGSRLASQSIEAMIAQFYGRGTRQSNRGAKREGIAATTWPFRSGLGSFPQLTPTSEGLRKSGRPAAPSLNSWGRTLRALSVCARGYQKFPSLSATRAVALKSARWGLFVDGFDTGSRKDAQ